MGAWEGGERVEGIVADFFQETCVSREAMGARDRVFWAFSAGALRRSWGGNQLDQRFVSARIPDREGDSGVPTLWPKPQAKAYISGVALHRGKGALFSVDSDWGGGVEAQSQLRENGGEVR